MKRPYVLLNAALTLDGFIDDLPERGLSLLHPDFEAELDSLRADCDAVIIGATTLRRHDPRLSLRSASYREERRKAGKLADPFHVTLTRSGNLSADLRFFISNHSEKIVYCAGAHVDTLKRRLDHVATIVALDQESVDPIFVLKHLYLQGVRRVLVEGGASIHRLFLDSGLVDEIRVSIASAVVGHSTEAPFMHPSVPDQQSLRLFELGKLKRQGNTVIAHYHLPRDNPGNNPSSEK